MKKTMTKTTKQNNAVPSRKDGYNHLISHLENKNGPWAAKMFGRLLKGSIDGAISFYDVDALKHVGLKPEKMITARTTLSQAGLISFRRWPVAAGGDYTLTARAQALIEKYWPSYRPQAQTTKANHQAPKTTVMPRMVVVPPRKNAPAVAVAA